MTEQQTAPATAPDNTPEDPAEALARREHAVAVRERAFTARAELERLGLPRQVAEALDLSSDQALEGGLKLVKLMQGLAPAQPAPKAHTPMPPVKELSYRALADLYGLPAERLIGAADADLFDPAVARSLWEAEQRVLESEAPLTVEETLPGARPGQVYVSHRFALLDREGQPTAIASISTDISGQPRADSPLGRSAERILALNDCFLSFGPDPEENMRRLTTLSNTLLGGSCATYQRAGRGLISSLGLWCAAANAVVDAPSGSSGLICTDLLARDDETVHVLRNLQSSPYARTDPNVAQFGLQTCVGRTVRLGGRVLGALCVLYREDYGPSDEDDRLLGIVASALAVEERRLRAEQRQAVAYGIADAASKSAGLHDLGCFIHQELRRLIEAKNFYLALDDKENRQIVFPYYVDETYPDGGLKRPPRPYASGLTEYVIRGGQALLLHEDEIRSRVREGSLQIIGAVPRVWLGVPLTEAGETIGMMAVQSVVVQRGLGPADRPGWLAWQFVRLIVLIGLAEELWFRGVWFEIVGRNALLSVVAGGALFGLSHLHQGLLMVLITGSAGCAYAAARHRGASLLSLALAHGLMDFANGILFPGAAARFSLTAIMVIAPALILTVALALMLIGRWPLRFRAKMGKRQEPHGSQAAD
mgnify:CR=1 FL=1